MKFISSSYDKENGVSTVVMQHFGKKFIGTAKVHPEEADYASELTGCEYAEIRATIAALKYERKLAKIKSDNAIDFVKSCCCYTDFDPDDNSAKILKRQLTKRVQRVNDLTDEINELMELLQKKIEMRKKFLEKRNKKDNS